MIDQDVAASTMVYDRLLNTDSGCLSTLSNLAECEYRQGLLHDCRQLVERGLLLANSCAEKTPPVRYDVASSEWIHMFECGKRRFPTQCQLAEISQDKSGVVAELLERAVVPEIDTLAELINTQASAWSKTPLTIFTAYSHAGVTQRFCIRVAMCIAHCNPVPFPMRASPAEVEKFGELMDARAWSQCHSTVNVPKAVASCPTKDGNL